MPMPRFVTLTLNPALDLWTSVDQVVDAHKMRCEPARIHPGGGGINVARVLQRLGADVLAISTAGGPTGERLSGLTAAERIRTAWIPIAHETRESFTVRESSSGREFRFVLPGPTLAQAEWRACLDRIERLPAPPAYLVASGSLPPGVPVDFHARVARLARRSRIRLVLDASGDALTEGVAEGVWGIKPSLRELRKLTGLPLETRQDQLAAARKLIARGRMEQVGLSLGPQGALLVTRDQALYAPALKVPVVGTVGAGDSFLAGWLMGWDASQDPQEALRTATATAAAALLAEGTALARATDIQRLLPEVHIEHLSIT